MDLSHPPPPSPLPPAPPPAPARPGSDGTRWFPAVGALRLPPPQAVPDPRVVPPPHPVVVGSAVDDAGLPFPPADAMLAVGSADAEDFVATGSKLVGRMRRNAGLRPEDVVLDLGCGVGRVARPLTALLDPRPDGHASYVGVDISAEAVGWCSSNITPRHPNFRFRRIDARNGLYNPHGVIPPEDVRLAEPDGSFDRAVVSSVFTHIDTDTVERYLIELHRVLRPGGRALVSFFLVTPEAAADRAALLRFPLQRHDDRSWVRDPERPEEIWAHDAEHILGCLSDLGFELGKHTVAKWANLAKRSPGQDLLVIAKPVSDPTSDPGPGPVAGTDPS